MSQDRGAGTAGPKKESSDRQRREIIWQRYRDAHALCQLMLSQTAVAATMAAEGLKDFPKRLPKRLRGQLNVTMDNLRTLFEGKWEEDDEGVPITVFDFPALFLMIDRNLLGTSGEPSEFETSLGHQGWVMLFAYLDGFMTDTVSAICKIRPEVLRTNRQLKWSEILQQEDWETLVDHMVELYVYEFGQEPLHERMETLTRHLGVPETAMDENEVEKLVRDEALRHIIVHNSGRANQRYISKTGRTDLRVGDVVPVTRLDLAGLLSVIKMFCGETFVATSVKFFGKKESDLQVPLRRREPDC